jgi:hypothetical protein
LGQRVIHAQTGSVVAQSGSNRVVPAQAALGGLVERNVVAGCQLGEHPRGVEPNPASGGRVAAGQPQGEGDGRRFASTEKDLLDTIIEHVARFAGAPMKVGDDIVRDQRQGIAEERNGTRRCRIRRHSTTADLRTSHEMELFC